MCVFLVLTHNSNLADRRSSVKQIPTFSPLPPSSVNVFVMPTRFAASVYREPYTDTSPDADERTSGDSASSCLMQISLLNALRTNKKGRPWEGGKADLQEVVMEPTHL
jgi:hypothetical protein